MNKIGIFFYSALEAPTGASTVLKNILFGFEKSNNFLMEIYALDNNKSSSENTKKHLGFIRFKIKLFSFLKRLFHFLLTFLSKYFLCFSKLYVHLKYHRNAKIVIRKNIDKVFGLDLIFFHDIITPFEFKNNYSDIWETKKKVVVLHTNGSALKMLFDYFPLIKKNSKSRYFYENEIALNVLKDMDRIILLSKLAQNNFNHLYPDLSFKTEVVQNGISKRNIPNNNKTKNKLVFTTVGTICERKGHDVLIKSIIDMSQFDRSMFELNIIGDGKIKDTLIKKCYNHNVKNINFLGVKFNVDEYLENTDCFVLASRDEGLPMAIIEAMSFGIPIIATNVGGIPDLVNDNINGLLVPASNSAYLKKAILDFIKFSSQKRNQMGISSYNNYINNFTQSIMIEKYEKIFNNILQ